MKPTLFFAEDKCRYMREKQEILLKKYNICNNICVITIQTIYACTQSIIC